MIRPCIAALLLLLFSPVVTHAESPYLATVVRISDGDTFSAEKAGGSAGVFRVRVYGIDSPEAGQPSGEEATDYASRVLPLGCLVLLDEIERDRYGRIVAVVYLPDGSTLQGAMIQAGHAWVYDRYCKLPMCDGWRDEEEAARLMGAGLWGEPRPIPPWKWRKGER